MKKALIIAASALALCSCGNKNKFVIKGSAEGLTGMVYMFDEKQVAIDSAAVKDGAFTFKGIADAPALRLISDSNTGESMAYNAQLILEPGEIVLAENPENPGRQQATGTPANNASAAYATAANALITEFRNPETTDERREAIDSLYNVLTRTTVEANLDNLFGVLLLPEIAYELSGQEVLDQIAKFSPVMQQTQEIADLKASVAQKMKTEIGQNYIDIVQNNAEGQPVSLKSVIENPANKYTLIDFWASWCGPCMGEVPYLIADYKEYHDKGFEIYGVSFDKDREKWLGAVAQNNMNWIQVSSVNGFDNQAAKDYAIQGIPSNFLIDAQGKIVATNLRGEALGEKLKELLGK